MNPDKHRLHTVHQLDSIYMGQMNSSYQKDGFGIQQTFDFNTYIGHWHNNKTQGLGLIILNNGTFIYANFNRDTINGLAIFDDGSLLMCGVYRNQQIVGVGFEYNHSLKMWRMNRYHKGVAIEVIKEEFGDIASGLPKITNVQQSIYFHLYSYIYRSYFPDLDIAISTELTPGRFFYGFASDKNMYGPGLCMEGYTITQAGFYEDGLLHGFGFRTQSDPFVYQFGCFHKGRKDGPFLEKDSDKTRFLEYLKGNAIKNLPNSQSLLIKNQKRYNFNRKDFFSAKNSIPFEQFQKGYQTLQLRQFQDKKQLLKQKNKSAQKVLRQFSPAKQDKKTKVIDNKYIIGQQKQKSSLQIIREKMGQYYGIVSGRKRSFESSPKKISSPVKKNETISYDDDEIAREENPFY